MQEKKTSYKLVLFYIITLEHLVTGDFFPCTTKGDPHLGHYSPVGLSQYASLHLG